MNKFVLWLSLLLSVVVLGACESKTSGVQFVGLNDGAVLAEITSIDMAVQGMKLAKAGELKASTGHFHIIIDGGFIPKGEAVAKDATHLHFGKAQSTTQLKLSPGAHVLTLQLADGHHVSYGEAWSQTRHVQVK